MNLPLNRVVGEVWETIDYGQVRTAHDLCLMQGAASYGRFHFFGWNRPRDLANVLSISQRIKSSNGLLIPIICVQLKGKIYVLDGQHILLACISSDMPVRYVILDGAYTESQLQEIVVFLQMGKVWTNENYLELRCMQGNENYLLLREFIQTSGIVNIVVATTLLRGSDKFKTHSFHDFFKKGKFVVDKKSIAWAKEMAEQINTLYNIYNNKYYAFKKKNFSKKGALIQALAFMVTRATFNFEKEKAKAERAQGFLPQGDINGFLTQLREAHGSKLTDINEKGVKESEQEFLERRGLSMPKKS